MLSIATLVADNQERLKLQWLAAQARAQHITLADGMAADLIGHLNLIHPARIQVLGNEELAYYTRFDTKRRQVHIEDLIKSGVPAIIIASGNNAPQSLLQACMENDIPLLCSALDSAEVIDILRVYLARRLAPKTLMHGVFLDVLGLGVLITGASGLGKSELALELISRGHGLVADDAVELLRTAPSVIEGQCPELLQNLLEVRGIGLLDIRTIFGETSVRRKMALRLIVHLTQEKPENFERLPIAPQYQSILSVPIRRVSLPVVAGRNLSVLVEAAVRNTILNLRGIDTTREFIERQTQAIAASRSNEGPSNDSH
ncbi:MAG TPA: HPr(Ser) kinase/phosphatase [Paenalcaligenes sp.]|nr:HPr(Ser) kinase/phosphatase [Paenalcaligenes sp.]